MQTQTRAQRLLERRRDAGDLFGEPGPLLVCGRLPVSSVQSVAATPKTSLRGETDSPMNTSGAMNRGVPIARVPGSSPPELARHTEVDQHDACYRRVSGCAA